MTRIKELSLHNTLLKEWDISFQISGESLLNILEFCKDINLDILFRFRKEEILIHQKSDDNTQYFEIVIPWNDVGFYNHGIEDGDTEEKKTKEKIVCINIKKLISDLGNFVDRTKPVDIKIDTKTWKRVEFTANNTSAWVLMIDEKELAKKIEKMPEIMVKQRAALNVPTGIIQIEPTSLIQICKLGPASKKSTDDDSKMFVELIPDKGLAISSGGKTSGRVFKIPVDSPRDTKGEEITVQEDIFQEAIDEIVQKHDSLSVDDLDNMGDKEKSEKEKEKSEEDIYAPSYDHEEENYGGQHNLFTEYDKLETKKEEKKKAIKKKDIKKKEDNKGRGYKDEQEKEDRNIHLEHQVLQWDVHEYVSVYIQQEFLTPFVKLKGTSPVIIEVRTDRPIVLIQRVFNDTKVLLTIAPRVENEED
jgi:hypothetical protein